MKKILAFLCCCMFFTTCDDGNVITVEFDFDDTFKVTECGDLVLYKTKNDPPETLSVQINSSSITKESLFEVGSDNTLTLTANINGSSNLFNYRTYNSLPSDPFCNAIPPSDLQIKEDLESTTGTVTITTVLTEDDNDGIPAELEDINGNGDLDDDDTDGDGLPNYLDEDDDGDNVRTATENPNYSENDGLTSAQDSDGDNIPDFLDDDDDGDGVLTRDEENNIVDQNPTNDITNNEFGPDYLNPDVANVVVATAYRQHTIKQTYVVTMVITNIQMPNITQDVFDFGTLDDSATNDSRTVTPEF